MHLTYGDRGDAVVTLQSHLHRLGYYRGDIDGIFGRRTHEAVASFQRAYFTTGSLDDATTDLLTDAVGRSMTRREHSPAPPHGLRAIEQAFGSIETRTTEGGYAVVTNQWDERHLEETDLPIVGRTHVHKRMTPIFTEVLTDLDREGFADAVRPLFIWCVRHKMHRSDRNLSTHAWGIACDVRPSHNPPGEVGRMHPEVVRAFEYHGFQWGGRWSRTRDDMHFQYCSGY